jgi:zinc protease
MGPLAVDRPRLAVLGLVLAAAACSAREAASPPAAAADVPTIAFEKFTLPNGLEVILSEDHRLPMVAVNLWYHVGPANEAAGRTGFAHLFEHMMFQGSKHGPGDAHFRLLEEAGASDINGTTDFDRTNYFETVPANQLELALWLEADRMGYLLDVVDETALANQQDVVRNERRQSVENRPYGLVEEALFHHLFPRGHPYYAAVIGSHADIQAARLEDVKSFFKTYYAPNNASLAIVGDIDVAATRKLVEKYFGSLRRGPPVPKVTVVTPPIAAERRAVVPDRVELPKVYLGWITPPIFAPGDAEADLAAEILGGGRSSRLYKQLVYEQQIAQEVSAAQYSLALGSVFTIEATARPGHSADELERAIDAALAAFRREGPTPAELERARATIETRIVSSLETLGGFGGVADRLNLYNHYLGTPDYLRQDLARYRTATAEAVTAFAAQRLVPSARVVIHAVPGTPALEPDVPAAPLPKRAPGTGAEAINADEPWRSRPPAPGPPPSLALPSPVSFRLANGLTVVLSERPGPPLVAAALVVKTGSDANPPDRPGLANFAVAMLDEGTSARSALQLADELAQIGATLETESTVDASQVRVRVLKRHVARAFDILADVVRRPAFPPEEVERQRGQRLTQLVQQRENPAVVATKVMARALYGPRHPYGDTELGTEAAIRAVTREELVAFWRETFVPNHAALVVAGAIGPDELRALAEASFGAWQPGLPAAPARAVPEPTRARVVLVDKPGAAQTQVRVATIGAPRSTPDYPTLEVLNAALGGLFSSRINLNLREAHGYTYGAYSTFQYRRAPGPFFVATGVRPDVTGASVEEILKEVRRIREAPLDEAELRLARESVVRSLPGLFETSPQTVGTLATLFVYDLGLDYFARYPREVERVTAAAVQEAARRYLVPDRMIVVAVGDRQTIEPQLRRLGLGAIEERDAEGVVRGRR